MDAAILECIKTNGLPGGVLWIERNGAAYHKAYGHRALLPAQESMTEDTIFDAASLTKVIATTPAVMLLVERQKVKLEAPVQTYLPEFRGDGKNRSPFGNCSVTRRVASGPGSDTILVRLQKGHRAGLCGETIRPPAKYFDGDVNFILLGEIVQAQRRPGRMWRGRFINR
jgi:CubicO group peptidase (beta-lactamase class C family)